MKKLSRIFLLPLLLGLCAQGSWAHSCQRLSASASSDYFPYSWQSTQNPQQLEGAMMDLLQRLSAEIKIPIDITYTGPWARTQQEANNGLIDLIAGAFITAERQQLWDFLTPPLTNIESVIWVKQPSDLVFQELADLQPYVGATIIHNSIGAEFDQYAKAHLNLYELPRITQAFKMLNEGRIDYVVYEKEPSKHVLRELQLSQIGALEKIVSTEALHLVLPKKSACNTPELRQRLTEALVKAQQEQWAEELLELYH